MSDSALLCLAEQIRRAVANVPLAGICTAAEHLDDAVAVLSPLVAETEHLAEPITGLTQARKELDQARQNCEQVLDIVARYLTSLGVSGVGTAEASVSPTPDVGGQPRFPVTTPLPVELDEHIFHGHAKPKKITGYHHRAGGVDAGAFQVVDQASFAGNGVYEGVVEGRTSEGKLKRKRYTTFFPGSWSREEVRAAIRAAFAQRSPVFNDKGVAIPGKWAGEYRGIRLEGFLAPGTDWDQASLDDVATAYPVFPEQGEEGRAP